MVKQKLKVKRKKIEGGKVGRSEKVFFLHLPLATKLGMFHWPPSMGTFSFSFHWSPSKEPSPSPSIGHQAKNLFLLLPLATKQRTFSFSFSFSFHWPPSMGTFFLSFLLFLFKRWYNSSLV